MMYRIHRLCAPHIPDDPDEATVNRIIDLLMPTAHVEWNARNEATFTTRLRWKHEVIEEVLSRDKTHPQQHEQ